MEFDGENTSLPYVWKFLQDAETETLTPLCWGPESMDTFCNLWMKNCQEIAGWHNCIFFLSHISYGMQVGFPMILDQAKEGGTSIFILDISRSWASIWRTYLSGLQENIYRLREGISSILEEVCN